MSGASIRRGLLEHHFSCQKVPLKVQFFMWTAVLDKISTMDMLWRKCLTLPSICLLYYQDVESTSHLLLHCPYTWEIWCGCAKDFVVSFIAPRSLKDLLLGWGMEAFSYVGRRLWKVVLAAICWEVWRERNNRAFRGHSEPAYIVYRRSKDLIIFWVRRCKGFDGIPSGALVMDWSSVIGMM